MSYSYAMKAWGGEPGLVVNDVPVAPQPAAASGGGHFGRTDIALPWERTARVELLKADAAKM